MHRIYRFFIWFYDRQIEFQIYRLKMSMNTRVNMYWPERKHLAIELRKMADAIDQDPQMV